jgi:hypothetical protein
MQFATLFNRFLRDPCFRDVPFSNHFSFASGQRYDSWSMSPYHNLIEAS